MPPAQQTAIAGLALAAGVAVAALLLAWRQWRERQSRESELSTADSAHFLRQDIRRWMGVAVMILLVFGLAVGSTVEPRAAGRANPVFVRLWLTVCVLVLLLLALALWDWLETTRYARRHRQAIVLERRQLIEESLRRHAARGLRKGSNDLPNGEGQA